MSRIIVRQLPKSITEEKLRQVFGTKGTITDLQLKYTPDGRFRQFCFIGYSSEEEAQDAINFFNNTYLQTNRLKVELCSTLDGDSKIKVWSKYAKDKIFEIDANPVTHKKKLSKVDEIFAKYKDDPEFQEFLQVHDKHRTLWSNDVFDQAKSLTNEKTQSQSDEEGCTSKDDKSTESKKGEKLAERSISDLDYMKLLIAKSKENSEIDQSEKSKFKIIDLFTIKMHNVPYKTKRQNIVKFFKPLKPYSIRLAANFHGFCYVGFKTQKEMSEAMLKNRSFIKGKQIFLSDFTEKNKLSKLKIPSFESLDINSSQTNVKWKHQEEGIKDEENISESGKIFFRNLAYNVTENDLDILFGKYGPVAELHLPIDSITRQIKGFGTVTFVMPEHAVKAFNDLDGSSFHGRLLHLIPAKCQNYNEFDENNPVLTFKQKKTLMLKKSAQQSHNWNTLFMGANTVAEILAEKFGTSKEKILDTADGGSSAAVRIALGETQVVMEMKKFLEENGVKLNVFDNTHVKRSKTIILAKNLPPNTTVEDLSPIFQPFGLISRIVLPPQGVTAIIEYREPFEAKKAFKKLAYSKYNNVPLYLEWAPEYTFVTNNNEQSIDMKGEDKVITEENLENKQTKNMLNNDTQSYQATHYENNQLNGNCNEDNQDEPPEPDTTVFIRNLNYQTKKETIHEHFKCLGDIHTIEIVKRKDRSNSQYSSLGYGFIQFKKRATADKAIKTMQFTLIDGNAIELKRSDRTLRLAKVQRKNISLTKQTGTKILVRNIPFQAKTNEVRDIFKVFGELRMVRLPKKSTPGENTHRGFGFVDYVTKNDASQAFQALSQSTHLYGRRLVLEWASIDDDEDLNELRKRTAKQYHTSNTIQNAKRSKRILFDD